MEERLYCVLSKEEINDEIFHSYEEALAEAKECANDDAYGYTYYVGEITLVSKVYIPEPTVTVELI